MTSGPDPSAVIAALIRQDRGRMISALIARFRDFSAAEDALQDAFVAAHEHWRRDGVPPNPQGWLVMVAQRRIIDQIRRRTREQAVVAELTAATDDAVEAEMDLAEEIPDERLRLIFTCCHPALDAKSRVALTLRTLGGLTTGEIARAFLDTESTMGQRLSRAKARIAEAGIPFSVPGPEAWAERLNSVLTVIYLIFNEGYFASQGDMPLRASMCDEAITLGHLVNRLRPDEPEVLGLLALMLTTHARRRARLVGAGVVPIEAQDHQLWDKALLGEADQLLERAMTRRAPGPFQIQAAIAALHSQSSPCDWRQIVLLYNALLKFDRNPVVRLNRAVALAELGAVAVAVSELDALADVLKTYQPFHAARADILAKAGRRPEAVAAYQRAIELATNAADARFLTARRDLIVSLRPWPGDAPGDEGLPAGTGR